MHKTHVERVVSVVAGTFFLREINAQALRAIVRKLLSHEVLNALRIDDWPTQIVYTPASWRLLMCLRIGCRQPQAQRGRCHEGCFSPVWSGQVMHFVKYHEFEGIAILRHQVT